MEEQVDRLVKKTWGASILLQFCTSSILIPQRIIPECSGLKASSRRRVRHTGFRYATFSNDPSHYLSPSITGKTTLAAIVSTRLNELHAQQSPGTSNSSPLSAFLPMDGYHLSRRQLDALPDPVSAHARRGAEFTFDGESFLTLVKKLREPLCPETQTLFAPSFDHAMKDPGE